MADPKIERIEIHEYTWELSDLGTDYNGFNLVYEPGNRIPRTGHILRIVTDVGVVGEYAGGSATDYAALRGFAGYLIGRALLR